MAACVLFMHDVDFIRLLVTHEPRFLPGRGWRRVLRCPGELGCFVSPEGRALMSRSTQTVHPVSVTDESGHSQERAWLLRRSLSLYTCADMEGQGVEGWVWWEVRQGELLLKPA